MHPATDLTRIVDRVRYSVGTATLIADDEYWDGHNWERHGRNTFLYRTKGGRYFVVCLTQWQGEKDALYPVDAAEAERLWQDALSEHYVPFEAAFPLAEVAEA